MAYLVGSFTYGSDGHQTCMPQSPIVTCEHRWNVLESRWEDLLSSESTRETIERLFVDLRITLVLGLFGRLSRHGSVRSAQKRDKTHICFQPRF